MNIQDERSEQLFYHNGCADADEGAHDDADKDAPSIFACSIARKF
jgi:hypothetical protein